MFAGGGGGEILPVGCPSTPATSVTAAFPDGSRQGRQARVQVGVGPHRKGTAGCDQLPQCLAPRVWAQGGPWHKEDSGTGRTVAQGGPWYKDPASAKGASPEARPSWPAGRPWERGLLQGNQQGLVLRFQRNLRSRRPAERAQQLVVLARSWSSASLIRTSVGAEPEQVGAARCSSPLSRQCPLLPLAAHLPRAQRSCCLTLRAGVGGPPDGARGCGARPGPVGAGTAPGPWRQIRDSDEPTPARPFPPATGRPRPGRASLHPRSDNTNRPFPTAHHTQAGAQVSSGPSVPGPHPQRVTPEREGRSAWAHSKSVQRAAWQGVAALGSWAEAWGSVRGRGVRPEHSRGNRDRPTAGRVLQSPAWPSCR